MSHEVIKFQTDVNIEEDKYFNIIVKNKKYPSCYHYNILIMLAKRLVEKDDEILNPCKYRSYFERRLNKNIVNA